MTADEVNRLPERCRSYIAALETACDPQGTIRENFLLREENKHLRRECARLSRVLDTVQQLCGEAWNECASVEQ